MQRAERDSCGMEFSRFNEWRESERESIENVLKARTEAKKKKKKRKDVNNKAQYKIL